MPKRSRRPPEPQPAKRRRAGHRSVRQRAQPDLIQQVAAAMSQHPVALLTLASTQLAMHASQAAPPFEQPGEPRSREDLLHSLRSVRAPETSALLAAMAALVGDEVLRRRVHREIADRGDTLPEWLANLRHSAPAPRAAEVSHPLWDGDDVLISATLPGGHPLTSVVYIDYTQGTLVKDAFAMPLPLDEVVTWLRETSGRDSGGPGDSGVTRRNLTPADARARIVEAITAVDEYAKTFPVFGGESWLRARPLVEWMTGLLPAGGTGYQRPKWDATALAEVANRFLASPFGEKHTGDRIRDELEAVLRCGADHGHGDPMRWTPTAVEMLLLEWIPRRIVDGAIRVPITLDLLRDFIRFCHHERGFRTAWTTETLASVDECEPLYQRKLHSTMKLARART